MDYNEFIQYVEEHITAYIDCQEETEVHIHTVTKNNGVTLDGLVIQRNGERMAPNIYLNQYFMDYEDGKDIEDIMRRIANVYENAAYELPIEADMDMLLDYEQVKEQIIVRLVGCKNNAEMLAECPHKRIHDMAAVFRWVVSQEAIGIATIQISNKELKHWGISVDTLYETALANTERLFPATLKKLGNMLFGYLSDMLERAVFDEEQEAGVREKISEYMSEEYRQPPLYVLTNDCGMHGAICILYKDMLAHCREELGHNFYILPSSIHEVILVPDIKEVAGMDLKALVSNANGSVVADCDILTDTVYYYNAECAELSVYE